MNTPLISSTAAVTLAQDAMVLVSWWKPVLYLVPLLVWAWIVSSVYDKHAARFHLPRQRWNLIHLCVGLIAAAVPLILPGGLGPWSLALGLFLMIVLLAGDLLAYKSAADKDDRVPQAFKIRLRMPSLGDRRAAKAAEKAAGTVELRISRPDGQVVEPPERETPAYETRVAAEGVFQGARDARAARADILPSPKDKGYVLSHMVDGVRQQARALAPVEAARIIDFWKDAAGMDVSDRRRKMMADVTVSRGTERHKVRVTTSGTSAGMRLSLVFDPEQAVIKKIGDLGLLDAQLEELKRIVEDGKGVVLLAAGSSGGRTTTLYSVLKMHDAYTSNVQTVEVEPQASLEGVRHNIHNPSAEGPEYATLTRSILRRDPQVVGVAELPDANTAMECAKSDHNRTRIYLSVRTDSVLGAVQAWVKAVGDVKMAGDALHGVVAQKLVRRLCTNCRVSYTPSADMLRKLNLPAEKIKQLYKKGGQVILKNKNQPEPCPMCGGIGYHGQIGVFELYAVGQEERTLLKAGNLTAVRAEWRKRRLPTMQQAALRRAIEGLTSVEEVLRVTAEQQPKQPPVAQPRPQPTEAP